jgi:hypothetical protein
VGRRKPAPAADDGRNGRARARHRAGAAPNEPSAGFLTRPQWLGIGAFAAILGAVLPVVIFVIPGGSTARAGHVGNTQAGSGNCYIQGGTDNTCQGSRHGSRGPAGRLSIHTMWPVAPGCYPATEVAVFPGGPRPPVGGPVNPDPRNELAEHGGAAFGQGFVTLTLTTTGNAVAQIVSIHPVFYRIGSRRPTWVYQAEGGCGETYSRIFALNLDKRTFTDQGLRGNPSALTGTARPLAASLGHSFHISPSAPAQITVVATACHAYYEWGLQITYVVGGHEVTKDIGTKTDPLRSVGALSASPATYGGAPPTYEKIKKITSFRNTAGCLTQP